MRVLVQRSKKSSVSVNNKIVGSIDSGVVLLVGFTHDDTSSDIQKLAKKVVNLRIFDDCDGVMNKSLLDVGGDILSISQFTLYGDASKGNRPSYINAMKGEDAIKLYEEFNEELRKYGVNVATGEFGAVMDVKINNDGPTTIWLESR
jgi:D-tyrosyl-tRNA(Tyr) deacylase